jgi:hypothetical protein
MIVRDVVTGQRIPLPRAADGTGPRRAKAELSPGDLPTPIEFEPEGCMENGPSTCTHWIQHAISADWWSASVDLDRCEAVIDKATAHDTMRRKVLRRMTPLQRDHFLGQPPPPMTARILSRPDARPLRGFED